MPAEVLIQDTFSVPGNLSGQIPQESNNGHPWSEAVSDGAATVTDGHLVLHPMNGNSVLIEISPLKKNRTYRLSADILDSGVDWLGLSFFNDRNPGSWASGEVLGPSIVLKNARQRIEMYHSGSGILGESTAVNAETNMLSGLFAIDLAVDWDGAAELSFYWNGRLLESGHPLSFAEVDAIDAVGISLASRGMPVVDTFTFEEVGFSTPLRLDVSQSGHGFRLQGTGGPPLGAFQIMTASNPDLSAENWVQLETGIFDESGGFNRLVSQSSAPLSFYRAVMLSEVAAPRIDVEPLDTVVMIGDSAQLQVVATGAPPLHYQWFRDTTIALPGETGPILDLDNIRETEIGSYSVVVSNAFGENSSRLANLVALPENYGPFGWASVDGGTTGGGDAEQIIVTNRTEFQNALNTTGPLHIILSGTVTAGIVLQGVRDKTIQGMDGYSGWNSFIQFKDCHNIIIRNCNIGNSGSDGITIQDGSTHFWVDHCTFGDCGDGQIDIVRGADYVTVSWCKFLFTDASNEHRLPSLIGSSNENGAQDAGHLKVTFHHNWWSTLCHGRMPRVRFGKVHVFNNFYSIQDHGGYCIVAAWQSEVLVENNYFHLVKDPYTVTDIGGGNPGKIWAAGNVFDQTTGMASDGKDPVFEPPYPYILEDAASARERIIASAGTSF